MKLRRTLALALLLVGAWQTTSALYIPAKAWLAQKLILRAWVASSSGTDSVKPWPWADMVPVTRLVAPANDKEFIVLSGASGEALAFGPGHVVSSDSPGSDGHIVIGGHRDTHFRFLQDVVDGQILQLHSRDGVIHSYEIESITVVDITREPLLLVEDESLLTLITCYPFDGLSASINMRYVVTARGT